MSRHTNKFINQRGISLLETAFAVAVLLVGIIAIVRIFPLALKVGRNAEQTTVAANLAQAKIEEIFFLGYENIPIGAVEAKARMAEDPENPFYQYWRQTDVIYVNGDLTPAATDTGIKKITVVVFWRHPVFKTEKNEQISILISQK